MSLNPTIGRLKETSDRANWWLDIYGSLDVPLVGPTPVTMSVDGVDDSFYLVDLSKLDEAQFEEVCQHVIKRFEVSADVVRNKLREDGNLPIRASEIESVVFDARLFL